MGRPDERILLAFGYTVAEYHLRGVAACYEVVSDDPDGEVEVEEAGTAPYRTRVLVMRPTDPAHFNHTVLLNWQNVSAGYEQPAPSEGELYEGYAWVGVSAQEIGLYGPPLGMGRAARASARGMVDEDPARYGMLQHPGDPGSFDIFADAARVVGPGRSTAIDPLAGLDVHHVIAVGGSQSAMRLVAYANALHRRHRVIDGYALTVWEGRVTRPGGRTDLVRWRQDGHQGRSRGTRRGRQQRVRGAGVASRRGSRLDVDPLLGGCGHATRCDQEVRTPA